MSPRVGVLGTAHRGERGDRHHRQRDSRNSVDAGPPTRITYSLTAKGEGLRTALHHISIWAATQR
ncbi:hypothetical protein [Nonomuraea sp. NPDC049141]|uniref:hypothetical protein n=1 Tax=Nonomuraea sp. NPDC049141 TaxID=3155500 RepID=UPI0033E6482C